MHMIRCRASTVSHALLSCPSGALLSPETGGPTTPHEHAGRASQRSQVKRAAILGRLGAKLFVFRAPQNERSLQHGPVGIPWDACSSPTGFA
eukprot:5480090-Pyramimonas_sp.AAC.1